VRGGVSKHLALVPFGTDAVDTMERITLKGVKKWRWIYSVLDDGMFRVGGFACLI
jgi:hypothetical protein